MSLTLTDAAAALRTGTTTSRALTEAAIATADRLDARVGTYLARFDEYALATADRADAELAAGHDRGPLHGIPSASRTSSRWRRARRPRSRWSSTAAGAPGRTPRSSPGSRPRAR
ncbi:hypothetical protein ACFQV8_24055 [Pseudonocardia benzenivorans]